MRILLAGASGVLGRLIAPQLLEHGHEVIGIARRPSSHAVLETLGITPLLLDVMDAGAARGAVGAAAPDLLMSQLTDLRESDLGANARMRSEGVPNLVRAARDAGVETVISQSIAWVYAPGEGRASEDDALDVEAPPPRRQTIEGVIAMESALQELPRAVILRYGALYGPGTWYAPDGATADAARAGKLTATCAWTPFVHVDDAAAAAVAALDWPPGIMNVVDDEPALDTEWMPHFAAVLGAPEPGVAGGDAVVGRPPSNARARALGWRPAHASWRDGLGLA
jgi:nucleoside-diphosphate-sugar epimerase